MSASAQSACIAWILIVAACGGGGAPASPEGSLPSAASGTQPASASPTPATSGAASPVSPGAGGARATATATTPAGAPASVGGSSASAPASAAGTGASVAPASAAGTGAPAAAGGGAQPSAAGATGSAGAGMPGASASDDSPLPSPGCMGGSLKAGRSMGSIQSSGGNRSYIQYIPSAYDGKTPLPLVVDLHPYSVGASFAESSSGFRQLADGEKYLYLAPQGIGNEWDSVGDKDEKFIRDLVNDVTMKGCVDLRRIYATGCSNGGAFSFLLMCTAEDIFAAVAPMCGTAFFDLQTMCMLDRPVSLMLRIGKQDTLNCWEGEGMTLNAPNVPAGTKVQCAKTVQKVLGEKNHCKGQPKMMAECEYLGDCDEGTEIAICDENTGHVVYEPNTAKDTWAFLKRFYKH